MKIQFARIQDEIRNISSRSAMGLPDTYLSPVAEDLSRATRSLISASARELVDLIEDFETSVEIRVAAGTLLGMKGDPRIVTRDPAMSFVPSAYAPIGLRAEHVDEVVASHKDFGVKREWIEKEVPRHFVSIRNFRIGKYLVTCGEYAEFLKATDLSEFPTTWLHGRFHPTLANLPVHTVSLNAALAYTCWLSEETGRRFRLPTEAEWEFAAAGQEGHTFPWGEYTDDCANTLESGLLMPTPVGCFPRGASPFGALDMAGNVEEWTADCYAPYKGGHSVADDLVSIAHGETYQVCRGGAYTRFRDLARCQRRHGPVFSDLYPISFRLVEEISHER